VGALLPGQGAYGALTDDRGRPVSDFRLYVLPEAVLLEVPADAAEALRAALERLVIADDVILAWADGAPVAVEASDAEGALALLAGPRRERGWFVPPAGALAGEALAVGWDASSEPAAADDEDALAAVPRLRQAMLRASRYGGTGLLDWSGPRADGAAAEALDALEIAAFRPGPAEFAEARVWNELGRLDAVSFTKGCFMGQEILNRVNAQGNLQRRLVALSGRGEDVPAAGLRGAPLIDQAGDTAGLVTRAARPAPGEPVLAFGFVRKEAWDPGTRLVAGPGRTLLEVR
jgi:folate-binding protein YgfZ